MFPFDTVHRENIDVCLMSISTLIYMHNLAALENFKVDNTVPIVTSLFRFLSFCCFFVYENMTMRSCVCESLKKFKLFTACYCCFFNAWIFSFWTFCSCYCYGCRFKSQKTKTNTIQCKWEVMLRVLRDNLKIMSRKLNTKF